MAAGTRALGAAAAGVTVKLLGLGAFGAGAEGFDAALLGFGAAGAETRGGGGLVAEASEMEARDSREARLLS